jgi:hypothetical protein
LRLLPNRNGLVLLLWLREQFWRYTYSTGISPGNVWQRNSFSKVVLKSYWSTSASCSGILML